MMKLQKQVIAKESGVLNAEEVTLGKMRTIVDPYTRHANLLSITRAKLHLVTSQ